MRGAFIDIDLDAGKLTVRFPVQERYQNPMGAMQGGMLAAAVDNAIGPLSFMVAPPSVTRSLALSYLQPVTTAMRYIDVTAHFGERNGRELTFSAEISGDDGVLLAHATALHVIIRTPPGS
jgi:acyl-coenzyme A thioesterase PaaI-like protein